MKNSGQKTHAIWQAVLLEQFFMDNKKDLAYLISDEAKRNLINVIVSGNIYVLIYLTGSALIYAT